MSCVTTCYSFATRNKRLPTSVTAKRATMPFWLGRCGYRLACPGGTHYKHHPWLPMQALHSSCLRDLAWALSGALFCDYLFSCKNDVFMYMGRCGYHPARPGHPAWHEAESPRRAKQRKRKHTFVSLMARCLLPSVHAGAQVNGRWSYCERYCCHCCCGIIIAGDGTQKTSQPFKQSYHNDCK